MSEEENDYGQFKFEPEYWQFVDDFNKSLEWVAKRQKDEIATDIKDVEIKDDGKLTVNGTTYSTTQWCFERFCGLLGIPRPFARKIPPDLLLQNIRRLVDESDNSVIFFGIGEKGNKVTKLSGVVTDKYVGLDQEEFLKQMVEFKTEAWNVVSLLLSDRFIEIDFANQQGDHNINGTQVGINVRSSDTGDVNTTARLLLNFGKQGSLVMPQEWGRIERLRNKKVSVESTLIRFASRIKLMDMKLNHVRTALDAAAKKHITDEDCKVYWQSLSKVVDKEKVDEIFGIDADERKVMFKAIKERKQANWAHAFDKNEKFEVPTDLAIKYSEKIPLIVALAGDFQFEEREHVRRLAGVMLSRIFPGQL